MKSILKKSSITSLLLNVILVLTLFVLLSFAFFQGYLPYATHKNQTITVPDVTGQNYSTVNNLLRKHDLRVEVSSDSGYNPNSLPLTVLEQFPKPLEKVKINRTVTLKLNARVVPFVTFPDVSGSSIELARKQLTTLGLRIGKVSYKPDMAINSIVSTRINDIEILPGEKVRSGMRVDLTIGMDTTSTESSANF